MIFIALFTQCKAQNQQIAYALDRPDQVLNLPDRLLEVSGLTSIDHQTFACVQDEKGIVFIYDAKENAIQKEYNFHLDGDYEGITEAHGDMYVLRSDGMLFEITDYKNPGYEVKKYDTGIPAEDNEGLCFDPQEDRLLIGSKSKPTNESKKTSKRVIYGFDLKTHKLSSEPAFEFDVDQLEAFAKSNKVPLPAKVKKDGTRKEPKLKFKTSAIAIHPVTGELYLLSAKDHFIFVFDREGKLLIMQPLDEKRYNKAEGITFYDNGDMLITNEGDDDPDELKKPTALRFSYKK